MCLRPATSLKNIFCHSCFPVNFAKFLRTFFLQSISGCCFCNAIPVSCFYFYGVRSHTLIWNINISFCIVVNHADHWFHLLICCVPQNVSHSLYSIAEHFVNQTTGLDIWIQLQTVTFARGPAIFISIFGFHRVCWINFPISI